MPLPFAACTRTTWATKVCGSCWTASATTRRSPRSCASQKFWQRGLRAGVVTHGRRPGPPWSCHGEAALAALLMVVCGVRLGWRQLVQEQDHGGRVRAHCRVPDAAQRHPSHQVRLWALPCILAFPDHAPRPARCFSQPEEQPLWQRRRGRAPARDPALWQAPQALVRRRIPRDVLRPATRAEAERPPWSARAQITRHRHHAARNA